jgi:O-antigen/teichoic acid export membrane protein
MSAALQGRERFLALNLLRAATAVAFQVVPLICAMLLGPSLQIILPAIVATKVATLLAFGIAAFAAVPAGRPTARRRLVKPLLAYGGWVTVSSLTPPLLVVIDRIAIGGVLGAAHIARYSVPFTIANRVLLLPIALAQALFPRLSESGADHAARLAGDAARTLCVMLTAVCGVGILLARPFLELWVGRDFATDAAIVMQIAFLGMWAAGLSAIPMFLLQSRRRPGIVARIHLLEILPYAAAVLAGVQLFGLPGAAAAWSLRAAAEACLLYAASGIALRWRSVFLPGAALVAASFAIAAAGRPEAPVALACAAAVGAFSLAWGLAVDPRLDALMREAAPALFRRGASGGR